eukprot:gnl/TRDRNA2_/TRDRNA2_194088_c0_seq1.p1 gnl/TRDRNA2_/TRDRNA2_194088_c0~~gnl/TRDRNA2_/TRDRNA2_194088_c0_seq1.p1  ORF type:complete len:437 (+),score=88.93 gnl/TRDRNA2_/TRDRNA2_194088_c0_seq1:133-1443(+)
MAPRAAAVAVALILYYCTVATSGTRTRRWVPFSERKKKVAAPPFVAARAKRRKDACSAATDNKKLDEAVGLMVDHMAGLRPPREIYSKHAVLVAPAAPLAHGGAVAAEAFAMLPRSVGDGPFATTFTKVVVLGHAESKGAPMNGMSVGLDVCPDKSLVDVQAAKFLQRQVPLKLKKLGPVVFDCTEDAEPCFEQTSPSLERALPFVQAAFSGGSTSKRSLKGHLLPVMMQNQSIAEAIRIGDALSLLVQSGGIWFSERVLFVMGGDMSHGLHQGFAYGRDNAIVKKLREESTNGAALYLSDLREGKKKGGKYIGGGPEAVPHGFGTILAGCRIADNMGLGSSWAKVSNSGEYGALTKDNVDSSVDGYSAILWWKDDRSLAMRLSSEPEPNKPKSTTTTTTTPATTKPMLTGSALLEVNLTTGGALQRQRLRSGGYI